MGDDRAYLTFLSEAPSARLVDASSRPFDHAVAAARTCYSANGIVTAEAVAGDGLDGEKGIRRRERRDALARSIYAAGHLTCFQHAYFQFAIENVSRHAVWAFLHAHPFYNSEQVSQRYVEISDAACVMPGLPGGLGDAYRDAMGFLFDAYRTLSDRLEPLAREAYFERFRGRRGHGDRHARDIRRKAVEVARYVLPIGAFTRLYHTVNITTLLRYRATMNAPGAPSEQRILARAMVDAVLAAAPEYATILEDPLPPDAFPEADAAAIPKADAAGRRAAREQFDARMDGRVSLLVSADPRAEELVADAVRNVLGLPSSALADDDALAVVLDPARNRILGETLNLTTMTPVTRALGHAHYVFRKRLSHSADSQDQRHRTTPASRPLLTAHLDPEPDYVVPALVAADAGALEFYREVMERAWSAIDRMRRDGAPPEAIAYLLPNAVTIRQTESADLSALRHKLQMRLCYNAQEEIWRAARDEAEQVSAVHPRIGRFLMPPCGMRHRAGARPICPEGDRFCGVPVWRLDPGRRERIL